MSDPVPAHSPSGQQRHAFDRINKRRFHEVGPKEVCRWIVRHGPHIDLRTATLVLPKGANKNGLPEGKPLMSLLTQG